MNALIIYGTRGGATRQIADEIGRVCDRQGFVVTVTDAKASRGVDTRAFDLVVVGSSVWAYKWTPQAMAFVKRNREVLAGKKVAFFWSGWAGDDPVDQGLVDSTIAKVTDHFPGIKPVGAAYFGSYTAFDSWNPVARMANYVMKKEYEKKGIDTGRPVDRRDWDAIRAWAADVAGKAKA